MILTACILAIKYQEDINYVNSFYAKVGGIKTEELINLELEFLSLSKFEMTVNKKIFKRYVEFLSQYEYEEDG